MNINRTKAPKKAVANNLSKRIQPLFSVFSGIDKITASWVCLSLETAE